MIDESKLEELVMRAVRRVLDERGYAVADEQLDKDQVAHLLGVSTRTVTTWMYRGGLPHHKGPGGRVAFVRTEVLRWAREHGRFVPLTVVHGEAS